MANPTVALDTNHGTIVLELFSTEAPKTVENFLQYVEAGFFDGTLFHRVIPNFMIQGGGFDAQQKQKPTRRADPERGGQRPHATSAGRWPWRAPTTRTAPPPSSSST